MEIGRPVIRLSVVGGLVVLLLGLVPVADAEQWGIEVSIDPPRTKASRSVDFTLTLRNSGDLPVTVCQVDIRYAWDEEPQNVFTGNRNIPVGGSDVWITPEAIPPLTPGTYLTNVTVAATTLLGLCATSTTSDWVVPIEIVANVPPTAAFSYSPPTPAPNALVYFSDESSDPDGTVVGWNWTFGDGTGSETQNPPHQFGAAGTYQVVLTVTDDDSSPRSVAQEVRILANAPPVASFSFSPPDPTPNTLVFFSDESLDADGTVLAWVWDFGDENSSDLQNPTHQFGSAGAYQVVLTVTDDDGSMKSVARNVQVRANIPPISRFSFSPTPANTSTLIQFSDQSSDADGTIVNWRWEFGDGTSSNEQNPVHQFLAAGVYQVTLTVIDDADDSNSLTQNVQIAAVPTAGEPLPSGVGVVELGLVATTVAAIAVAALVIVKRKFRPTRRWGQAGNQASSSSEKTRWRPR